jgi:hypothetical protein
MIFPPGGIAVLEVYDKRMYDNYKTSTSSSSSNDNNDTNKKIEPIGTFGIIAQPGPPLQPFIETKQQLYSSTTMIDKDDNDNNDSTTQIDSDTSTDPDDLPRVGAIKYMSILPNYRGKNIGPSHIQASQGCNYIVLVADDKGTSTGSSTGSTTDPQSRLVQWYQRVGNYSIEPLLQDILGSPNSIHGTTMIAPTIQFQVNDNNEPIFVHQMNQHRPFGPRILS